MSTRELWAVRAILAALYIGLGALLVRWAGEGMTGPGWVILCGAASLIACLIVRHGDDE